MVLHDPSMAAAASLPIRPRLCHVSDDMPGIRRRRCGKGFTYVGPDGATITCTRLRGRIAALAVPPAWQEVWICTDPEGHIQATGIDADGRKQYRYHPDWNAWRAEVKFGQLPAFGTALPRIRRRVQRDLQADPGSPEFAVAALVLLLDRAHLRIGSRRHTATSGTFGATTLLTRHVTLGEDGTVRLRFRAKGGKRVRRTLRDKALHRVLQEIDDLPGRNLFTWMDPSGGVHPVTSGQVNDWLSETTGGVGVTAKTFRTWAGTVSALAAAVDARREGARLTVSAMTGAAAERLHNTPAICRKSYIHPEVLALTDLPAEERDALLDTPVPATPRGLLAAERRLLSFLSP
ncbi:DNA topoisomerase IB [Plastorhodobacter daqingensis]|uniref:DNA topoisomerase n=1 Tax=Plastorhodobacter daqingensis TaxID=1387281 RepID=A0ABW2UKB6_9RHOB